VESDREGNGKMSTSMDPAALRAERDRLAREHGPWVDNVALGPDVATVRPYVTAEERRTHAILQAVADGLGGDLSEARVLDLGAAEGRHSIEFARRGAEVVAVEGRPGNCTKMRFLRDALSLDRLEVVESDVRKVSVSTHGEFDVVLCLGLLYHLEGKSAAQLIHAIGAMTKRLAVVDTLVSLDPKGEFTADGRVYSGRPIREFDSGASREEQMRLSRSSIGNPESFWLTRPSLFNLLSDAGFSSVMELRMPRFAQTMDRVQLVAFRGTRQTVLSAPGGDQLDVERWPEREPQRLHPVATWRGELKRRVAPYVPAAAKEWARQRREQRLRSATSSPAVGGDGGESES
jgi:SAM-dependent methyltransferase